MPVSLIDHKETEIDAYNPNHNVALQFFSSDFRTAFKCTIGNVAAYLGSIGAQIARGDIRKARTEPSLQLKSTNRP